MAEDYQPEETPGLDAASLTGDARRLLGVRWPTTAGIRTRDSQIVDAGEYACLDIVQPDAPFLVDSVMGEIADAAPGGLRDVPRGRRGRAERGTASPTVPVSRNR